MITNIQSEKLIVISDLHVGNPFSLTRKRTVDFLRWASENGYDLCINGDGFEVAQVSRERVAADVPEILNALKLAVQRGTKIYYVVGNHDIFFEHFLNDWGGVQLAPFLNVASGSRRIRVEHGHLYDPFFVKYPRLYEFGTWLGGIFLRLSPRLYKAWIQFERIKSDCRKRADLRRREAEQGIAGEHPNFFEAATHLEQRGFDAVVFGHTHHAGEAKLPLGGTYVNPGSWMLQSCFVKVENGYISLCKDPILPLRRAG